MKNTNTLELTSQDRALLILLQKDGRMSTQALAEATAMSNSACWRRVKLLEDRGVIKGYSAILDPGACGLDFHAMVQIVLSRHNSDSALDFISAVQDRPEVLDCFATTGDSDYHLRVRCQNIDAYNEFLEGFMFKLDAVATVRTNLVLRQAKHETGIAL